MNIVHEYEWHYSYHFRNSSSHSFPLPPSLIFFNQENSNFNRAVKINLRDESISQFMFPLPSSSYVIPTPATSKIETFSILQRVTEIADKHEIGVHDVLLTL